MRLKFNILYNISNATSVSPTPGNIVDLIWELNPCDNRYNTEAR